MNRTVRFLATLPAVLLLATTAQAVTADHLQCFKIKDAATAATYQADLTPSDANFAPAAGCTIKLPAKFLCVDAVKSNVTPPPPGSPDGIAAQQYLCYKTKCPAIQASATVADQFASRAVAVKSTGLLCAPIVSPATCTDAIANGTETDVDCGGGACPPCNVGKQCAGASDCASGFCSSGVCQAPTPSCTDGIKNGMESDIDCGGGCAPCANGKNCLSQLDCSSGSCSGGVCQAPTCIDAVKNGNETDVDCGGGTCGACNPGKQCILAGDCASGVCSSGVCQAPAPSCTDGIKNGMESDVDCGGSCAPCVPGKTCTTQLDCDSGSCSVGVCQLPTCVDAVKNGSETDVDCGGGTCGACNPGKQCILGSDCLLGVCLSGTCP